MQIKMGGSLNDNKRIVIYTALFGGYDLLVEPPRKYENCDFICFTDDKTLVSDIWDVVVVENVTDPVRANREIKFLPHKYVRRYEFSIYIDSNIRIINDPSNLVFENLKKEKICIPQHFERNCIYKEIKECLTLGKISSEEAIFLNTELTNDNYPQENGLGENNIILRRHNDPQVVYLMEKWWEFFIYGPKRDQLSLMYLAWKYNIKINLMHESSRNKNKYFRYELHLSEQKLSFFKRNYLFIRANRDRNLIYKFLYSIKKLIL